MNESVLKPYLDQKLLKSNTLGDYTVYCYTKDLFFSGDASLWDDVTRNHRGRLYYRGAPVNHPLPKIFNMNEMAETAEDVVFERMTTEPYDVYDKVNGHLLILSMFHDDEGNRHIVLHTKGALEDMGENNILTSDKALYESKYREKFEQLFDFSPDMKAATVCMEVISPHDKHTLYDQQLVVYGGEPCFVLLCAYVYEDGSWHGANTNQFSTIVGMPVAIHYPEMSELLKTKDVMLSLHDHEGIEGYVIHFPEDDTRVKIKTKDYWRLRAQKDLSPERIVNKFVSKGCDGLQDLLQEELYQKVYDIIKYDVISYASGIVDLVNEQYGKHWMDDSHETRVFIGKSDMPSTYKNLFFARVNGKSLFDVVSRSKDMRREWAEQTNVYQSLDITTMIG